MNYNGLLSDFTSAYRKFRSCETSLLRLTEDWRTMRDRGELVAVVFMDLSKAFDVFQYPLLLSKLRVYGMDDKSYALIRNHLFGRTQGVKFGDTLVFNLGKRKAWGPAGECARSYAIQHFH